MRHLLTTLFILICSTCMAQKGLEIAKLFDGRYRKDKAVTETHIKGAKLDSYGLDEYHSLTFKTDAHTELVESLVLKDAHNAWKKEQSYIGGRLYLGFYTFPAADVYRYIFYLNSQLKNKPNVTLIYMDGTAGPETVKRMLKQ